MDSGRGPARRYEPLLVMPMRKTRSILTLVALLTFAAVGSASATVLPGAGGMAEGWINRLGALGGSGSASQPWFRVEFGSVRPSSVTLVVLGGALLGFSATLVNRGAIVRRGRWLDAEKRRRRK